MSDFAHLTNKWVAERARWNPTYSTGRPLTPIPTAPPPPYQEVFDDSDSDSGDDFDSEPTTPPPKKHCAHSAVPLKLTINAATSIQGNHNLVPITSPLQDATRFIQLLLFSMNQIHSAITDKQLPWSGMELTLNCGVTVIGDRNVVGQVGLKSRAAISTAPPSVGEEVVVGAKRKREDEQVDSAEQATKQVAKEDSVRT